MSLSIPSAVINWDILNEIISMDEDEPSFSKELIIQYIDQVDTTFAEMEHHLHTTKDLSQLDSLGHFLKGSSAALGLQRIAWVCERIQNLGRKAENTFPDQTDILNTLPKGVSLTEEELKKCNGDDNDEVTSQDVEDGENTIYIALISKASFETGTVGI